MHVIVTAHTGVASDVDEWLYTFKYMNSSGIEE